MSPELRQFLTDWLAWAEAGAPPLQPFSRRSGLCSATHMASGGSALQQELQALLLRYFGPTDFPFGGEARYHRDASFGTQHENMLRVQWVRAVLERFPETENAA